MIVAVAVMTVGAAVAGSTDWCRACKSRMVGVEPLDRLAANVAECADRHRAAAHEIVVCLIKELRKKRFIRKIRPI